MILVLQTNVPGALHVWLVGPGSSIVHKSIVVEWHGSDQALALVDRILQKAKIESTDIQGIQVVRGPGAFTAVRTGLIIANTLAHILNVPVHGIRHESKLTDSQILRAVMQPGRRGGAVRPDYGRAPNITKAKRR